MSYLFILAGFVILMLGGETLVNGAVAVAKRLKMPPLVIGIVLVGFGTSVPELVTSIQASLQGSPGIAVGNVVGSNIANVLLVAGAGAILVPIAADLRGLKRDGLVLMLATVMFIAAAYAGGISFGLGLMFVAALVCYVAYLVISERRRSRAHQKTLEVDDDAVSFEKPPKSLTTAIIYTIVGIGLTVLGADFLVRGATAIALDFGVSETIIGLTIVAIGTSLPELATAVVAGLKGEADVSVGNIIGSNIYNILAIIGLTAMVKPLPVDPAILKTDIWVMAISSLALVLLPFVYKTLGRKTGIAFLIGYVAYLYMLYLMI